MKISACIITRDEEQNLPRCLASLKNITDEIVIVDSGSTDATESIARNAGARFIPHAWEGYVGQKNFALTQAAHPWVLSIDADEELDETLQDSIRALRRTEASEKNPPLGYRISRVARYRNQWIWHGDWYPDVLVRLFQKNAAQFVGGRVHERLVLGEGINLSSLPRLSGHLRHYTYQDAADRRERMLHYAELWAQSAQERGRSAQAWDPAVRAAARFVRGYALRAGFLDGAVGFEIARGNAQEVFWKYRRLRELTSNGDQNR